MPRIFDNIAQPLLPALHATLQSAQHADFCVGFFNLRGWGLLADDVERFAGGPERCCRVLIGMHERPDETLRAALRIQPGDDGLDIARARQLTRQMAEQFRAQLTHGAPTNADELALRRLAAQIRSGKVIVRLHLRYLLHAKLYLIYRDDFNNPVTGYLGSSNLTMAGLQHQGELNVDVLDHSATADLVRWFADRWDDRWSVDISDDLATIIEESWAAERLLSPYLIYLKIAYHLSHEARAGLSEYTIPREFHGKLFAFQEAAVLVAARYLERRGGVLLGDVVGLGKTLMATALARLFKDRDGWRTLIIAPRNLVAMWQEYNLTWDLSAEIVPLSQVQQRLPELKRRYHLVIIDESHSLRNREGRRYRAIQEFIGEFDCKVVLLSATPYNKSYLDLGAQLRLFVPEDADLGIRPEALFRATSPQDLLRMQVPPRSLRAFERSEHADDWRELMRLYMVRRTRSFIKEYYAATDTDSGRAYLPLADGQRFFFPERLPRAILLPAADAHDPYGRLAADAVVETIADLALPRYGLANYLTRDAQRRATDAEKTMLQNLSRAGKRLIGFSRTNLFKRLESGGAVFLQSIDRHVLRNAVVLHAIVHDLPLPLGAQTAELLELDTDLDAEDDLAAQAAFDERSAPAVPADAPADAPPYTMAWYTQRAAAVYAQLAGSYRRRFTWLRPALFGPQLRADLERDSAALADLLRAQGPWLPAQDAKLQLLLALVRDLGGQKVLIFSQFADTVAYLTAALQAAGHPRVAGVTGQSDNPTELARRFSPLSHGIATLPPAQQIDVLVATDVLSEGQNLQDACQIVNYDLPWAIIRLIQRAGRVDRIGQQSPTITCYTFLPSDGVERILRLRARLRQRLHENSEVVGTDERFFDDGGETKLLRNLYTETSGALDEADDAEVDLSSYALQIWRGATAGRPELRAQVERLPAVVYSARALPALSGLPFAAPAGVLSFVRTAAGADALAWLDAQGKSVTQSQSAILKAAECAPDTPALPRSPQHHELVRAACDLIHAQDLLTGGLGSVRGARFRLYEALKRHVQELQRTAPLLVSDDLTRTTDDVYRNPLRQSAIDAINRKLHAGADDAAIAELAVTLRTDDRLVVRNDTDAADREPQIVCSLGLIG